MGQRRCVGGRQIERPEGFVPRQDDRQQHRRGDARHRHRREHIDDLVQERSPVHARGFKDVDGDLLEIGVEHPDEERQVEEQEHQADADEVVEQVQVARQEIDRHEHADRGHHFGRQHPHQEILGPLARRKGHRPGGGNGDDEAYEVRADRKNDRVRREAQIVRPRLHLEIILESPVEEQEFRRHRDRVEFALEAGQERPEDREEDQEGHDPGEDR